MRRPRTLVEALEQVSTIEDGGYRHLLDERSEARFVSYAELARRSGTIAAAIQDTGVARGDRVGLVLPDSAEFVEAFYGTMVAGAVPVPVYPPIRLSDLGTYLENTAAILRRAGCRLVIAGEQVRTLLGSLLARIPELRSVTTLARLVPAGDTAFPAPVSIGPDDVAFLQFTSGSTAAPKGVALTHRNLLANIAAISAGLAMDESADGVSWLPLYHDMGLIGFVLTPLTFGARRGVLFLSPVSFLKRPALWLQEISRRQATITFAPNFAYGLCARRVRDSELEGLDLSSLRVAGCGAEPIHHATLDTFHRRFASIGFRRTAFLPCYGMAEHCLAATFTGLEDDLTTDDVDPGALGEGRAIPAAPGAPATRIVNCGRPFPGHDLRILGQDGQDRAEREVGEVVLRGPSVMRGYWEDAETTASTLRDGWLHTGDLGYLAGGHLHICGRTKDLLISNGRNYHPQDLEMQAGEVEGVRRGNVVAFAVQSTAGGQERIVVAAETRAPDSEWRRLARAVEERILAHLGLKVDEVVLLPPGALPKTSSGKLQRSRTREIFVSGRLGAVPRRAPWRLAIELARSRWHYLAGAIRRPLRR